MGYYVLYILAKQRTKNTEHTGSVFLMIFKEGALAFI